MTVEKNETKRRRVRFQQTVERRSYAAPAAEPVESKWYSRTKYELLRCSTLATANRNRGSKTPTAYTKQLMKIYTTCLQGCEPDSASVNELAALLRQNKECLRGLESMSTDLVSSQMRLQTRGTVQAILKSQKLLGGLKNSGEKADTLRLISLARTKPSTYFASAMAKVDNLVTSSQPISTKPQLDKLLQGLLPSRLPPSTIMRPNEVCAKHA